MRRIAFVALVAAVAPGAAATATSQTAEPTRTLLAVFAHPDDETIVSPVLARYAREGAKVVLAIATDGSRGVREHAGIPAGEPLATARAGEARCACEKLGIEPPVLVGIRDGDLWMPENQAVFVEAMEGLLADLQPDAVVTWGPDGVSGHPDHRMVSAIVTEVFQRTPSEAHRQLYYAGLPAERLAALAEAAGDAAPPIRARSVLERFLPVRVAYEESDAAAAQAALDCHESQYTPEERRSLGGMARSAEQGHVALRPWFVEGGGGADLFHR